MNLQIMESLRATAGLDIMIKVVESRRGLLAGCSTEPFRTETDSVIR